MGEQAELSAAIVRLVDAWAAVRLDFSKAQAMAEQAMVIASRCPDSFVSRGIRAHVLGWFFYDPTGCIETLGDVDALDREGSVLGPWSSALGRFCTREYDHALESLDAAERVEPGNPFIAFLKAVALAASHSSEACSAVKQFNVQHAGHPLCETLASWESHGLWPQS